MAAALDAKNQSAEKSGETGQASAWRMAAALDAKSQNAVKVLSGQAGAGRMAADSFLNPIL